MPDPVATQITSASSSLATTTVSFSAQTAGTLLLLVEAGDDYKSGNPSGWTAAITELQTFHGLNIWYKIATGAETSVAYVIGSASRSTYQLIGVSNIDGVTPVDVVTTQIAQSSLDNYTTPSAATSAGRRISLAILGGSNSAGLFTGMTGWLNSYAQVGVGLSTSTPGLIVATASLVFDGGGSTSSGATYVGTVPQARTGVTLVLKNASAATVARPVTKNSQAVRRAGNW